MSGDQMPSAALPRMMRAVQVGAFGGVEQLHLSSIPVPMPRRGEVLVRVGAAGVGPWDALAREGKIGPLPLPVTLGADLAGIVVKVGDDVEDLSPGDAIFGVTNDRFVGAYAEFAHRAATCRAASVHTPPATTALFVGEGLVSGAGSWTRSPLLTMPPFK